MCRSSTSIAFPLVPRKVVTKCNVCLFVMLKNDKTWLLDLACLDLRSCTQPQPFFFFPVLQFSHQRRGSQNGNAEIEENNLSRWQKLEENQVARLIIPRPIFCRSPLCRSESECHAVIEAWQAVVIALQFWSLKKSIATWQQRMCKSARCPPLLPGDQSKDMRSEQVWTCGEYSLPTTFALAEDHCSRHNASERTMDLPVLSHIPCTHARRSKGYVSTK